MMDSSEFCLARSYLGLSKSGMAVALGMSRTTVRRYEAGDQEIPRVVELACWALTVRPRLEALRDVMWTEGDG